MKNLAPIVLFTYNRLWHTQQTIKSLQENELAYDSELFIYSDGGKDEVSWNKVNEVRKYLKTVNGFHNVTIIEQEKNIGLADSIISGVTEIISKYGKIIVLEDDIVTSKYFLRFMNDALDFYENEEKVWHISGWNYPIGEIYSNETFLWRVMNCWGWSTWADRWIHFKKNTKNLIKDFKPEDIYKFNLDGANDFWEQIIANDKNQINTWAIFWYATIFMNYGLSLNPYSSYTKNIGFDSSGEHCNTTQYFTTELNNNTETKYTQQINENISVVIKIKEFYSNLNNINNKVTNFSSILRNIINNISLLNENKNYEYILYGAGTGCDLVLSLFRKNISFIIDMDKEKQNTRKNDIPIKGIEIIKNSDYKIIITVFGREEEIKKNLINNLNVNPKNIIQLIGEKI